MFFAGGKMNIIDVNMTITSLDSETKLQTTGEYKKDRIKFDDELNSNYILFRNKTVEYYKKGTVEMKFKFNCDLKTKGFYTVMNNTFSFDIVTNNMIIKDGYLYIKYDLYQNNELVNQTNLELFYQVKEEL